MRRNRFQDALSKIPIRTPETIQRQVIERRSLASAIIVRQERPVIPGITLAQAVSEGYKTNGWVYRCVSLTQKAVASVPFKVYDTVKNEYVEKHPINDLLANPYTQITKQDFYELATAWLELCGNAYFHKVKAGGKTTELIPISPDRIAPVSSTDSTEWLKGYALKTANDPSPQQSNTDAEEIVHLKYVDPANPIIGMGPLQAASAAISIDNSQKQWNYTNSENRGALEGIFTFDDEFKNQGDADAIKRKINQELTGANADPYYVLGVKSSFIPVSQKQSDTGFIAEQGFSRDEIHVIMGVPPILTGAVQARYTNYQESETIYWFSKVIFVLQDISDGFNLALREELADNQVIKADTTNVPAIRRANFDLVNIADKLSGMGVPFEEINRKFELGIEEFPGWDKSTPRNVPRDQQSESKRSEDVKKKHSANLFHLKNAI